MSFLNLNSKSAENTAWRCAIKDGNIHRVSGTYLEIKPPEKVVFSWICEPNVPDSIVTVEFRDLGQSTEIILTHERLPSVEERDKHSQGWNGCLDSLAKYL